MAHSGHSRWQSILAVALVSGASFAAGEAFAQNYRSAKPQIAEKEAGAITGRVATILRDANAPGAEEKEILDKFFMKYLFPTMTVYQPPETLGKLSTLREQLFVRYINTAKSQGARDFLTDNALKAMGAVAKGDFHPAVRYNAVLIISQLDQTPGKPVPAATELMVSLLENEEFNKAPVPTALKVAAMLGLKRHMAAGGIDPALGERITKAATAIAAREKAPEDASAEVYGWVRRQAAEILTLQFANGVTPPVQVTLVKLISDKSTDLDDRCAIAQLLKPTMYPADAKGIDLNGIANALGDLTKQVLTLEAKDAKKFMDEGMLSGGSFAAAPSTGGGGMGYGRPGGGGGYGRGGEMGRGGGMGIGGMPEELGPTYERRRMLDRTLAIIEGATAVSAGAPDEVKTKLGELVTALRSVTDSATSEDALNEEIAPAVEQLSQDVNRLVATWAPPAAADEAPADEDFPVDVPAGDSPADDADAAAADKEAPAAEAPAATPAADEPAADAPAAAPASVEEAAPAETPPAETPAGEAPAAAAG